MSSLSQKWCEFRIIKLRDKDAYAEFYRCQYPRVHGFVRGRVSQHELAEEIADEAFLEVWRYIYVERQVVEHLVALLLTVARRLVVDFYRKQRADSSDLEEHVEQLSDEGSFLQTLELSGETELLQKALGRIKSEYREVLTLRFLDQFEMREIAAVLQKTPGAVRVLIHRALAALRSELGKNK